MDLTAIHPGRASALEMVTSLARWAIDSLERYIAPLVDLGIRYWVAAAFFASGLTKIQSWDSTLALFENEYSVPLLPPEVAAYMGTFTELVFPALLLFGLGTRFAAGVLFVFNVVAVISYPDLSMAGLSDHRHWGLLLLVTLAHGPGKISIDHFFRRHFFRRG